LPDEQRFVLRRNVVAKEVARRRMAKTVGLPALRGKTVFVDGYNVLITTESLRAGFPVYLCDDGFLRDTRGIFRSYKPSQDTSSALLEILNLLAEAGPDEVVVLLDQQMSGSGEMDGKIRIMMAELGLSGDARTARDVDHQLKVGSAGAIIATSDGNVIDASPSVIDLPAEIALRHSIIPLRI
jgi:hypothetical protein